LAPHKYYPPTLHLTLESTLKIARWAENGNLDTSELEAMLVMDNQLFTIEPKAGSLDAGESVTLTCTFKVNSKIRRTMLKNNVTN
jgi:hypothetical protein